MKKQIISVILVFMFWSLTDFLIHGVLLISTYEATSHLWRPEGEMKMGLMSFTTFILSVALVGFYQSLVEKKNLKTGLKYGLFLGFILGGSMGLGTYCYMPIPIHLAVVWFFGTLLQMVTAGAIVGTINKNGTMGQ